jgi:hypothetical protein
MVSEENGAKSQRAFGESMLDRGRLARVDDDRLPLVVVQQPDVVVGKRR